MKLTERGFSIIRNNLFKGGLTQSQVDNINFILDYQEKTNVKDIRQVAYVLATIQHETDATFLPIEEYGKGKGKPYGKKIKYDRTPYAVPDKIYYGRGHVQATWYEIYKKLTDLAKKEGKDWDFLNNPELMLEKEHSIWAAFKGMEIGLYTGVKLSNYFNDKVTDWKSARRIINGTDKADLIASYAVIYNIALREL